MAVGVKSAAADILRRWRCEFVSGGKLGPAGLCLARASRLVADTGNQRLQVGFARVIERTAAWAAGASPTAPLREQLVALLTGAT